MRGASRASMPAAPRRASGSRINSRLLVRRARTAARDHEAELAKLCPQRLARHAEAPRRRAPMIAVLPEPRPDRGQLDLTDDVLQRPRPIRRLGRCALDDPGGEQLGHDALARLGAEDEAMNLVLELA